jgi:hypothetical protein
MTAPSSKRQRLREWILACNEKLHPEELADDTALIEERIISSLQIADLILFLESLRGAPVRPDQLHAAAFRNLDALCATFFDEVRDAA